MEGIVTKRAASYRHRTSNAGGRSTLGNVMRRQADEGAMERQLSRALRSF